MKKAVLLMNRLDELVAERNIENTDYENWKEENEKDYKDFTQKANVRFIINCQRCVTYHDEIIKIEKALRKEVRSINKGLRTSGNGIYISVGAILIIILLIILL